MLTRIITLVFSICLIGCATGANTSFVENPQVDFTAYERFSWIADEPRLTERPAYGAKNDERIENAIVAALEAKGYRFVADRDEANFVIGYSVGIRDNLKSTAAPEYFGANWTHAAEYLPPTGDKIPGRPTGAPDSFWDGIHKDYGATIEKGRPEGRLTIDLFDVGTKQPAWQGSIEKKVTQHDREHATEAFNKAIAKLFAPFPSRSAQ